MQANLQKNQGIAVAKKHLKAPSFHLGVHDHYICQLTGCIYIYFNLSNDHHISNICKMAAQQVNVIRRIGHNLNPQNRLTISHTFVLS